MMPTDNDFQHPLDPIIVSTVRCWAAAHPPILAAWIFGSRAKGTWLSTSDLDVAIELQPYEGMTARQTYDHDLSWAVWEDDLAQEIDLKVHLLLRDGERTPKTEAGVLEAGIEVYRRSETL